MKASNAVYLASAAGQLVRTATTQTQRHELYVFLESLFEHKDTKFSDAVAALNGCALQQGAKVVCKKKHDLHIVQDEALSSGLVTHAPIQD